MDIDAFVAEHEPTWRRLQELCRGGSDTLVGEDADEAVDLYRRTATHLSMVRASAYDPQLEARLSTLVTNARALVTGSSPALLRNVAIFFAGTLPAALYRLRWAWISVGLVSLGIIWLLAYRVIHEPGLADAVLSPKAQDALVNHDFASYYSESPAQDFAFQVFLNNSLVSAMAILLGFLIVPVLIMVWQNMANLGLIAGYMLLHDRADVFFGLLLPHGLLELTCIFVACAAGLRIGWAWIAPGARTRARALAEEGRIAAAIAIGLACWLAISGALEGFITPSTLPAWARVAIGTLMWLAFLAYTFILGARAQRKGYTGDIAEGSQQAYAPEAAL